MKILVVDDESSALHQLDAILRAKGLTDVTLCQDPRQVSSLCKAYKPDLILLDLLMPGLDGEEVLEAIHPWLGTQGYLPIVAFTEEASVGRRECARRNGVKDFLSKPFDAIEVVQRVTNLLEARKMQLDLLTANRTLERRIKERTEELELTQYEIVNRLGMACNLRDDQTGDHIVRVGNLCRDLALQLGVPPQEAELIGLAARLHDIGKIGVPDEILLKPGKLTPMETDLMRLHTIVGGEILAGAGSEVLSIAHVIAMTHHERWDGTGYPNQIVGEDIPLCGRICAVADVYDSLTSDRPYKQAWSQEDAIAEITASAGSHFDPDVVTAFLKLAASWQANAVAA